MRPTQSIVILALVLGVYALPRAARADLSRFDRPSADSFTDLTNEAPIFPAGNSLEKIDDLRAAAKKGDPDAEYRLGAVYATGYLVPQNPAEAFEWFRKSAKKGTGKQNINLASATPTALA